MSAPFIAQIRGFISAQLQGVRRDMAVDSVVLTRSMSVCGRSMLIWDIRSEFCEMRWGVDVFLLCV